MYWNICQPLYCISFQFLYWVVCSNQFLGFCQGQCICRIKKLNWVQLVKLIFVRLFKLVSAALTSNLTIPCFATYPWLIIYNVKEPKSLEISSFKKKYEKYFELRETRFLLDWGNVWRGMEKEAYWHFRENYLKTLSLFIFYFDFDLSIFHCLWFECSSVWLLVCTLWYKYILLFKSNFVYRGL